MTAQTARQKLGEVITFELARQDRTDRRIADRIACSAEDVGRFKAGTLVPSATTWRRLCQLIAKSLFSYQKLYSEARAEQESEREIAVRGLMTHRNGAPPSATISTNIGDKIKAAKPPATPVVTPQPAIIPPPHSATADLGVAPSGRAADGRMLQPARPDGSMSRSARQLRTDFVRDMLKQRPDARTSGADSIIAAVRRTFGVGIDPRHVEEIRTEVARERLEAEVRAKIAAEATATPVAIPVTPPPASSPMPAVEPRPDSADHEREIGDLVEMLVSSVPTLRTLHVEVDDNGEASFTFEIRRAIWTGGGRVRR